MTIIHIIAATRRRYTYNKYCGIARSWSEQTQYRLCRPYHLTATGAERILRRDHRDKSIVVSRIDTVIGGGA